MDHIWGYGASLRPGLSISLKIRNISLGRFFFLCVFVCVCVFFVTPQSKPLERLNVKMVSFQLAVVAVAVVTSARHVEKKCDHMPRRWFIVMKIVGLEPKNIQASVLCHVMQSLLPLSKLKGGLILSQ